MFKRDEKECEPRSGDGGSHLQCCSAVKRARTPVTYYSDSGDVQSDDVQSDDVQSDDANHFDYPDDSDNYSKRAKKSSSKKRAKTPSLKEHADYLADTSAKREHWKATVMQRREELIEWQTEADTRIAAIDRERRTYADSLQVHMTAAIVSPPLLPAVMSAATVLQLYGCPLDRRFELGSGRPTGVDAASMLSEAVQIAVVNAECATTTVDALIAAQSAFHRLKTCMLEQIARAQISLDERVKAAKAGVAPHAAALTRMLRTPPADRSSVVDMVPDEVLAIILALVGPVTDVGRVNRRWARIASHNTVVMARCESRWVGLTVKTAPVTNVISPKRSVPPGITGLVCYRRTTACEGFDNVVGVTRRQVVYYMNGSDLWSDDHGWKYLVAAKVCHPSFSNVTDTVIMAKRGDIAGVLRHGPDMDVVDILHDLRCSRISNGDDGRYGLWIDPDNKLVLCAANDAKVWTQTYPLYFDALCILVDTVAGLVHVIMGSVHSATQTLHALDIATGNELWSEELPVSARGYSVITNHTAHRRSVVYAATNVIGRIVFVGNGKTRRNHQTFKNKLGDIRRIAIHSSGKGYVQSTVYCGSPNSGAFGYF
jgi:hypothetical protein